MEQVTNSLSASIPLFYKLTEVNVSSLNQTQQAFTMQLNNYLLLRRFIFYLIQKKLISIEESSLSSIHSHRRQLTDEAINPSSPIPIMTPVEVSESLYSPFNSFRKGAICLVSSLACAFNAASSSDDFTRRSFNRRAYRSCSNSKIRADKFS